MRYSESLVYLNSFLNLERITYLPDNRRWNLARMHLLLEWFSHPEKSFFSILIAGTKGKGSTGFFLESILTAAKQPSGFYSSPHLEDPRERIRVRGKMVSKSEWVRELGAVRRTLRHKRLAKDFGDFTYFEIMTLLAMLIFKKAKVRVGIFEVGMGGRLDATNVLNAKIAILTPIHLDHEAFLGDTVPKIAREKAAIIRPGSYVVVSRQKAPALAEILIRSRKMKADVYHAPPARGFRLGLAGDFQQVNAGAAVCAANILRTHFRFRIPDAAFRIGLSKNNWPGRLEFVCGHTNRPGKPKLAGRPANWLLDGAHNPASVEALTRYLKEEYPRRKRLVVFGTSRDKRSDKMLATLSRYFKDCILTPTANPRSQEIGVLLSQARKRFSRIFPAGSPDEALQLASKVADQNTLVVVTGSFYLIGEARRILRRA